uniref:Aa_trans domain-containing protein n=1 Tax=Parastrongyloides trichosuri TaxID=131310 RepID=A0A0N4ZWI5_PARTI
MSVGGLCSFAVSVIISFLPLTRLIYSMVSDKLLYIPFADKIFGKGGSPRVAVLVAAIFQFPFLFINSNYLETIFNITILCGSLKNIISSIAYYYISFNEVNNITGTEITQSHELSYRKFSEGSDSENDYNTDDNTSSDEELDYVFRGQYKRKTVRYGTINKSHNCLFEECKDSSEKNPLGHIYESAIQTEVRLINCQTDGKIFNCISKRHSSIKEANIWLIIYLISSTIFTGIISNINFEQFKNQSIFLLVVIFTTLTFTLFGILYVITSISFSDLNDSLNETSNNSRKNVKRKEILQRLFNILILQLSVGYFAFNLWIVISSWMLIGIIYYFILLKFK